MQENLADLPAPVRDGVQRFANSAREACGTDLAAIVLFGSAAEGRLRPASDVNLMLIFKAFAPVRIDGLREELRLAHAAIRLNVMFILEAELGDAAEAFAVKFADILHRRRVLWGPDPLAGLKVSRAAALNRVRQSLINLVLRMRERYAMVSLREEQLAAVIADLAGPLRGCAATLAELEGSPETRPKEALIALASLLPGGPFALALEDMSSAREGRDLPPGRAGEALAELLGLAMAMRERARALV